MIWSVLGVKTRKEKFNHLVYAQQKRSKPRIIKNVILIYKKNPT